MALGEQSTAGASQDTPAKGGSDEQGYGSESEEDEDEDNIFVEVFVQEMHDTYTSYGSAKLNLAQICS